MSKLFTIDSPEDLGAPLEFLYYLYILSNAGGKPIPPPVRLILSSAETGIWLGTEFGKYSVEQQNQGFYNPVTDLATPEILAYEHSALRTTRII